MAVGFPTKVNYATGDVLSATNMNDLSGTVNLLESAQYAAGKNKIINGDFSIWQRGTSFSSVANGTYTADRWRAGTTGDVVNITRQSFTANDIVALGYGDAQYFLRMQVVSSDGDARVEQRIEDVRTFANQSITVSYWAKASTSTSVDVDIVQNFGSGGSTAVSIVGTAQPITTSWVRYSQTFTIPSISGKTIGTDSYLRIDLKETSASTSISFDFWGVQVEGGVTASPFQTATGTKQGELAACQRYYYRLTPGASGRRFGVGMSASATLSAVLTQFPVSMRTNPTALEQSGTAADYSFAQGSTVLTSNAVPIFSTATTDAAHTTLTCASGGVDGYGGMGRIASATAYLGWSAEL